MINQIKKTIAKYIIPTALELQLLFSPVIGQNSKPEFKKLGEKYTAFLSEEQSKDIEKFTNERNVGVLVWEDDANKNNVIDVGDLLILKDKQEKMLTVVEIGDDLAQYLGNPVLKSEISSSTTPTNSNSDKVKVKFREKEEKTTIKGTVRLYDCAQKKSLEDALKDIGKGKESGSEEVFSLYEIKAGDKDYFIVSSQEKNIEVTLKENEIIWNRFGIKGNYDVAKQYTTISRLKEVLKDYVIFSIPTENELVAVDNNSIVSCAHGDKVGRIYTQLKQSPVQPPKVPEVSPTSTPPTTQSEKTEKRTLDELLFERAFPSQLKIGIINVNERENFKQNGDYSFALNRDAVIWGPYGEITFNVKNFRPSISAYAAEGNGEASGNFNFAGTTGNLNGNFDYKVREVNPSIKYIINLFEGINDKQKSASRFDLTFGVGYGYESQKITNGYVDVEEQQESLNNEAQRNSFDITFGINYAKIRPEKTISAFGGGIDLTAGYDSINEKASPDQTTKMIGESRGISGNIFADLWDRLRLAVRGSYKTDSRESSGNPVKLEYNPTTASIGGSAELKLTDKLFLGFEENYRNSKWSTTAGATRLSNAENINNTYNGYLRFEF